MSIRDRLARMTRKAATEESSRKSVNPPDASNDEAWELARYKFLLRVAQPEVVEQVHREAFAALMLEERERLFQRLRHDVSEPQRPESSDPAELARAAVAAHQGDHGYLVRLLRRPAKASARATRCRSNRALPGVYSSQDPCSARSQQRRSGRRRQRTHSSGSATHPKLRNWRRPSSSVRRVLLDIVLGKPELAVSPATAGVRAEVRPAPVTTASRRFRRATSRPRGLTRTRRVFIAPSCGSGSRGARAKGSTP